MKIVLIIFFCLLSRVVFACSEAWKSRIALDPQKAIADIQHSANDLEKYCVIGVANSALGRYEDALLAFTKALESAGSEQSLAQRARVLLENGRALAISGAFSEAEAYFNEAMDMAQKAGDLRTAYKAASNVAGVRSYFHEFHQAEAYVKKAIALAKSHKDAGNPGKTDIDIASFYHNLAYTYIRTERFNDFDKIVIEAAPYLENINNPFMETNFKNLLAKRAFEAGDYHLALESYEAAYERLNDVPKGDYRIRILHGLALTHEALGNVKKMNLIADQVMLHLQELDPPPDYAVTEANELKGRSAALAQDYKIAVTYYQRAYNGFLDMYLAAEQKGLEVGRLEARFAEERRAKEFALLEAEKSLQAAEISRHRTMLFASTVIFVLFSLAAYLFWQRFKQSEKIKRLYLKIDTAREERTRVAREIHDTLLQELFSISIQSQRAIKHINSSPKIALEALQHIRTSANDAAAEGRRAILNYRSEQNESLCEELLLVVKEAANGQHIDIHIPRQDTLWVNAALISDIRAIVKEAVRNAVNHAAGTKIEFSIDTSEKETVISISDCGRGFDLTTAPQGRWGISGMRERAEKIGADLKVFSGGGGTIVRLTMPLPLTER